MLVFELAIRNRTRCNITLTSLPNANLTKSLLIFETHQQRWNVRWSRINDPIIQAVSRKPGLQTGTKAVKASLGNKLVESRHAKRLNCD